MPLNFSLLFNLFGIDKFWRPQPTLPCLGLQNSISRKTRTVVSLSSMKGVFAESLLRKQAWRKKGRVGFLHQNIFTRKVIEIAIIAIIIHIPSHTSRVPRVPVFDVRRPRPTRPPRPILDVPCNSLVSRPRVTSPHTHVPMSPSPCPRPSFIHSHDALFACEHSALSKFIRPDK